MLQRLNNFFTLNKMICIYLGVTSFCIYSELQNEKLRQYENMERINRERAYLPPK